MKEREIPTPIREAAYHEPLENNAIRQVMRNAIQLLFSNPKNFSKFFGIISLGSASGYAWSFTLDPLTQDSNLEKSIMMAAIAVLLFCGYPNLFGMLDQRRREK